jgi:hypothetical protein
MKQDPHNYVTRKLKQIVGTIAENTTSAPEKIYIGSTT